MKHTFLTLLFAIVASMGTVIASNTSVGGIWYELDSKNRTAQVTYKGNRYSDYDEYSGSIIIPSSILYSGMTYNVTGIMFYAFRDCSGLTSVIIPNSVTRIGDEAFTGCSGLTSVTIPSSVTSLDLYNPFSNCCSLTSIVVDQANGTYDSRNNCNAIIKTATNELVVGCKNTLIPNSVTSIGFEAFYNCSSLTSVTIPNSVTSIGSNAFSRCSGLTSIDIPSSVTHIRNSAFYGCSSLTSVTIPNSVTSIESRAFSGCSGLTSLTISNSVTRIESAVFDGCTSLNSVIIPDSVTLIDYYAFRDCSSLTSITIPNSVTKINYSAFYGCSSLTTVTIDADSVAYIGQTVFDNCNALQSIFVPCGTLESYKSVANLSSVSDKIKYKPLDFTLTIIPSEYGNVNTPANQCELPLYAEPDYGYQFVQWSDGNTENPRMIELTQDTTFAANFAPDIFTFSVTCDTTFGNVIANNGEYEYLTELALSASDKYGYHFACWSDGAIDNPRTIILTKDTTIVALYAKNNYAITLQSDDEEQGTIGGSGVFEYLDEKQIEALPNYGYHFTQWGDGNTDNPRVITLTQDTTFTAFFGVDKSGTCGDDNLLIWFYDENNLLTISGNGSLNSNYTFGVEAPDEMESVVIESGVSSVGERAFMNHTTLKNITISHGVNTIGDKAFYGCSEVETLTLGVNLQSIGDSAFSGCKRIEEITVYADRVIDITETTFSNIGRKEYVYVYVPQGSLRKYQRDDYWSEFDLQVIGATTTSNADEDVSVVPSNNSAEVTWSVVTGAATYELIIQDAEGNAICTLIFNAQGQLQSIAFAAPSRAQTATQTAGFTFTVTGLDSGSHYGYTLAAKDSFGGILNQQSGTFDTTSGVTTYVENSSCESQAIRKFMQGGQLFIVLPDGTNYSATGVKVD